MGNKFYVHRHLHESSACLKVFNEAGEELSVSFDNSAGAMVHRGRVSMARFKGPNWEDQLGEEKPLYTAEDFLKELASHLGFEVVPQK